MSRPELNGGVILGGREYRLVVPREAHPMLKFLAAANQLTEGEMAQRLLVNATVGAFNQTIAICAQRALEAARDALFT